MKPTRIIINKLRKEIRVHGRLADGSVDKLITRFEDINVFMLGVNKVLCPRGYNSHIHAMAIKAYSND